jgi:hypothetical protein
MRQRKDDVKGDDRKNHGTEIQAIILSIPLAVS